MSSGYSNQPPYPGVSFPALQPAVPLSVQPRRPWPLRAVNRWMTISIVAVTLLAVLLAVLAPRLVSSPLSTSGMTLAYQNSLTRNDSGHLRWDENSDCKFTSTGYVVTDPDPDLALHCLLRGSSYQNFTLHVRVVYAAEVAIIGFLADDRLALFGSGRFLLYRNDPETGQPTYLFPKSGISTGSAALHPTSLGVSERVNDITIQVQEMTYSFYANGQLLATYTAPTLENPGPISLGADAGQQAEFSDIAIYTPR